MLAIILQGPIGIGTIIVLLCLGILVGLFDKLLHKMGSPVLFIVWDMKAHIFMQAMIKLFIKCFFPLVLFSVKS